MEQTAGPLDVHLIELRGTASERNFSGQVDDSFCALDCSPERFIVRDGPTEVSSAVDS
jgi:hypothetical protein